MNKGFARPPPSPLQHTRLYCLFIVHFISVLNIEVGQLAIQLRFLEIRCSNFGTGLVILTGGFLGSRQSFQNCFAAIVS